MVMKGRLFKLQRIKTSPKLPDRPRSGSLRLRLGLDPGLKLVSARCGHGRPSPLMLVLCQTLFAWYGACADSED